MLQFISDHHHHESKPVKLVHSFLFCSCVYFCLYGPFNCISFHKSSRQLSTFSLCSSGLLSALSVLSTIYLFVKVSFSPVLVSKSIASFDVHFCSLLGSICCLESHSASWSVFFLSQFLRQCYYWIHILCLYQYWISNWPVFLWWMQCQLANFEGYSGGKKKSESSAKFIWNGKKKFLRSEFHSRE